MKYYILLPNDTEATTDFESNLIGEQSFKVFWAAQGLKLLMNIVDTRPDLLEHTTIKTDNGETINIEEFLKRISKLQVRIN